MFITRADLHSPSSDEDHGPSDKTTQIIIGVVVGGVAAIASAFINKEKREINNPVQPC